MSKDKDYHHCFLIGDFNGTSAQTINISKRNGRWTYRHYAGVNFESPSIRYCPWCGQKLE